MYIYLFTYTFQYFQLFFWVKQTLHFYTLKYLSQYLHLKSLITSFYTLSFGFINSDKLGQI